LPSGDSVSCYIFSGMAHFLKITCICRSFPPRYNRQIATVALNLFSKAHVLQHLGRGPRRIPHHRRCYHVPMHLLPDAVQPLRLPSIHRIKS
jgi:hypothetical protein